MCCGQAGGAWPRRVMAQIAQPRSSSQQLRDSAVVTTVRVERRTHDAARGHSVVATLGQKALAGTDFPLLLDQTVSLIAETVKVAVAAVCEVATDGRLLLRAAHGLTTATVGETFLAGVWSDTSLAWLNRLTPVERVGRSMQLYFIPPARPAGGADSLSAIPSRGKAP